MPAFAEHHDVARAWGALALCTFSAGTMIGGFLVGAVHGADDRRRLLLASPVLGLAMMLPLLGWSIPSMCVVAFFAGPPIAPTVAAVYGLVDDVAPRWAIRRRSRGRHRGLPWDRLGNRAGGAVVDVAGIRWTLALPPLVILAGAGFVVVRRKTLRALPA